MHDAVLAYVRDNLPAGELRVLDLGSRDVNGTCRPLVGRCVRYVGVDIRPGPGVDVVADAATVRLDDTFDVVVCTELFEHAADDVCAAIVATAHHHLSRGGLFIATMAGPGRVEHSAIEATSLQPGEFYRNVTKDLLIDWLLAAGFATFDVDQHGCDLRCVARKGG